MPRTTKRRRTSWRKSIRAPLSRLWRGLQTTPRPGPSVSRLQLSSLLAAQGSHPVAIAASLQRIAAVDPEAGISRIWPNRSIIPPRTLVCWNWSSSRTDTSC